MLELTLLINFAPPMLQTKANGWQRVRTLASIVATVPQTLNEKNLLIKRIFLSPFNGLIFLPKRLRYTLLKS